MTNPRIQNYTQYNDQNLSFWQQYGYHEPHFGGELWAAVLWDLRQSGSIGYYYANSVIYRGLSGIPTNSSFLQYRQAIINADINYYSGTHANAIRHLFYLKGIGLDFLGVNISGPSLLRFKEMGTYTANVTGGSGQRTYQWYKSTNGTSWNALGTSQTQTYTMSTYDVKLRCNVHDTQTGEDAVSPIFNIAYDNGLPKTASTRENIPTEYSLEQNYPNPFNPITELTYALPEAANVEIKVFDILGREVAQLVNEFKDAGNYTASFNAASFSSGIYIYRIIARGENKILYTAAKRLALMK